MFHEYKHLRSDHDACQDGLDNAVQAVVEVFYHAFCEYLRSKGVKCEEVPRGLDDERDDVQTICDTFDEEFAVVEEFLCRCNMLVRAMQDSLNEYDSHIESVIQDKEEDAKKDGYDEGYEKAQQEETHDNCISVDCMGEYVKEWINEHLSAEDVPNYVRRDIEREYDDGIVDGLKKDLVGCCSKNLSVDDAGNLSCEKCSRVYKLVCTETEPQERIVPGSNEHLAS